MGDGGASALAGRASGFVGRAAELDRLQAWAVRPGVPALLVRGEEGIGKTRLVQEFAAQAAAARTPRVVIGRCAALAGVALPFVALTDVLRQLLAVPEPSERDRILGADRSVLAHLLPELGPADPLVSEPHAVTGRQRFFEAVRAVLDRAAARTPIVVVVEDVHWMGPTGLELLDLLIRSRLERVGILATARADDLAAGHPMTRLVAEAERARLLELLPLGPLPRAAADVMVATGLGRLPSGALTDRIYTLSGGRPFFIEELTRHEAAGGGDELPWQLSALLALPLRELSEAARTVLRAVAAAGPSVAHAQLAAVVALDRVELDGAVREAVDANLLEVTGDGRGYRFRQELARQAVYDTMLPGERLQVHGAYAAQLALAVHRESTTEPYLLAALAHHYDEAGEPEAALRWTLAAARAAERVFAFRDALPLYQRALVLWPQSVRLHDLLGEHRVEVLRQAARVADLVADHQAGLRFVEEALTLVDPSADPLQAAVLEERRAWYQMRTFATPAPRHCQRAVDLVPAQPPTRERARVLATHSWLLATAGRAREAIRFAEEALVIAHAVGSERERASALTSLGASRLSSGDLVGGEELLRQACALAARVDDVDDIGPAYDLLLATRLRLEPDLTVLVEQASAGHETLRRLGVAEGQVLLVAAIANFELARWGEAADQAREAAGYDSHAMRACELLLDLIATCRGETRGTADVPRQPDLGGDVPSSAVKLSGEWLAEAELIRGQPDQAAATVEATLSRLEGTAEEMFSGRLLTLGLRAQADRATRGRDAFGGAEVEEAERAAARLSARAKRIQPPPFDPHASPVPTAAADAATWDAERLRLAGAPDPEAWATAARAWWALGRRHRAAYAQWRQAEALLGDRQRRRDAGPVVREALATATGIGAVPLQQELDKLARRAHLPSPRTPDHDPPPAPAGIPVLTRRERDVLRLLAAGLSNHAIADALVLSPKTVNTHVTHLLGKLQVHDRIAAAGRAERLGLLNPQELSRIFSD